MTGQRYTPSEAASASDDLNEYDMMSDHDPRSLESSVADLQLDSPAQLPSASTSTWLSSAQQSQSQSQAQSRPVQEPKPSDEARMLYETAGLRAEDIQAYAQRSVSGPAEAFSSGAGTLRRREKERPIRVYVDGVFDIVNVGTIHQFRQAKLSFPSAQLLVGPFTDIQLQAHEMTSLLPHVERCEFLRHVRWVDEVLLDAAVVLSEDFLTRHKIDYVAIEEGSSVDPAISKQRLAGYDLVKSIGKAITTRKTRNVQAASLLTSLMSKQSIAEQVVNAPVHHSDTMPTPPQTTTTMHAADSELDTEPEPEPDSVSRANPPSIELESPPEPREDFGA